MIIVGNAVVLSKDNFWNSLLSHFKKNKCLFEGTTWKHLIQSNITFAKPEPYYGERTRFFQEVNDSIANMSKTNGEMFPLTNFDNHDLVACFSKKYRKSQMGFDMLPEQKSMSKVTNRYAGLRHDEECQH
jgi:regulator of nonsense transcripts 1